MTHFKKLFHSETRTAVAGICMLVLGIVLATLELLDVPIVPKHPGLNRKIVAESLSEIFQSNQFANEAMVDWQGQNQKVKIEYTLDSELQEASEGLLKRFRPDYGAIVTMNPSTGEILSMASYTRGNSEAGNLNLRASFPSASVFKVVTAAAAIEKAKISTDFKINYNGANHTLYRRNALSDKTNRWTRRVSLREAFALSINTAFARIGIKLLTPTDLFNYAYRFGFNRSLNSDLPLEIGFANVPSEDDYEIAQTASGFTRENKMSPIQGAVIASIIASDGQLRSPYIVKSIVNEQGEVLYKNTPLDYEQVIEPETAEKMRVLMEATVSRGTSRRSFREFARNRYFEEIEVGGKTGSLTGTEPRGKCDWFVGYARHDGRRIAVAALTVNRDKWQVKSSYLAQSLFQKYYADLIMKSNHTVVSSGRD